MTATRSNETGGRNPGRESAPEQFARSATKTVAELLDVRAVAELLQCSPRHVYRLSDGGKMPPPRRLGALVRWSARELESWIAEGCPAVRTLKGGAR